MNNFEKDELATNILLDKEIIFNNISDEIRNRVLNITFDCTPNWGILWAKETLQKENWYFLDNKLKNNYYERIKLLNVKKIEELLYTALENIIWKKLKIEWFSIYWSFLYSLDNIINDLDVLILISWKNWITYDALKYPFDKNLNLFFNSFNINKDELWLTIISIDELNKNNKNYIITDSALVDKWTTFNVWKWINSLQIPDFIINQNSQKLINWGISSLYNSNETILKRISESLFMRDYMIKRWRIDFLSEFNKEDFLINLKSKWTSELLTLAFQILDLLKEDEIKIRKNQLLKIK